MNSSADVLSADVLLTGASAFVGSAVLRALLRESLQVRALVRPNGKYRDLAARGVQSAKTPTGKIIVAAASGKIPAYVDTGLNVVHVDDVASGHLAALKRGRLGERYILGGEISRSPGSWPRSPRQSGGNVRNSGFPGTPRCLRRVAGEARSFLTSDEPLASWAGVRLARHKMFFTSAKAEQEFGYRARPHMEALNDAIVWFSAHGYLRLSVAEPKLGIFRSPFS